MAEKEMKKSKLEEILDYAYELKRTRELQMFLERHHEREE